MQQQDRISKIIAALHSSQTRHNWNINGWSAKGLNYRLLFPRFSLENRAYFSDFSVSTKFRNVLVGFGGQAIVDKIREFGDNVVQQG